MRISARVAPTVLGAVALAAVLAGCTTSGPGRAAAPVRGAIVSAQDTVVDPPAEAFDPLAGAVTLRRSSRPGYTLLNRNIVGETPAGFDVWVSPYAPHRRAIANAARNAVSDLRHLGIAIRWRGYGYPRASEGVIRLSEGSRGCVPGTSVVGITWPHWSVLASGGRYMTHADTVLCPSLFRYHGWVTGATVRHELGHALGLAHTNYRYHGSYQVMNASLRPGVLHYRAGDKRGLRLLAGRTRSLKTAIPPAGRLSSSSWQASDNRIVFTGSAALRFYPHSAVTIQLVANGRTIARTAVRNAQSSTFRLSTPWPGGTQHYCVRATSSVNYRAVAQLGCVTWRG